MCISRTTAAGCRSWSSRAGRRTRSTSRTCNPGSRRQRITTAKIFCTTRRVYDGDLYIQTNEDSPRYRVFGADAGDYDARALEGDHSADGRGAARRVKSIGGQLFARYEQNAHSLLRRFMTDGKPLGEIELPAMGTVFGTIGRWDHDEAFFWILIIHCAAQHLSVELAPIHLETKAAGLSADAVGQTSLWTKVEAPSIRPDGYSVKQVWYASKDGTRVPMFLVVHKNGIARNGQNPDAADRLRWLQREPDAGVQQTDVSRGSIAAASLPWRTCAVGPSSAKTGIAPACSTRSRMSLTT